MALVCAVATAGCGLGPGDSSRGEATLTVTRDYGSKQLVTASERDPAASETVIRFLDRNAEITTRYGGGFVQSIEGIAGSGAGGSRHDWFFYVNGVESSRGGAAAAVHGGDRIWWDYRDWTGAMRVPAVVGSYPEPLGRGGGRLLATPLASLPARLRQLLAAGPARSGVFARLVRGRLLALDQRGRIALELSPGAGLVAALRDGEQRPILLVTGANRTAVEAARRLLRPETLRDRYAVAIDRGRLIPLPVAR
ncbi:MAG: hypothetical protein QOJ38_496 [Solirubrobacterales bacterium]|nr:hypothetical protein [Solirubrobacterales bacterium]